MNVLIGVWVFDTASYVGGASGAGPHRPRTSPKTVEGAVIGLAAGTLAVWIAGLYMDWISGWESLILGLAICPAAYLGDLFESMLKRDAGAKDSGRLLLAHGGVLDRFDALLFGVVAGYFLTVWLVYQAHHAPGRTMRGARLPTPQARTRTGAPAKTAPAWPGRPFSQMRPDARGHVERTPGAVRPAGPLDVLHEHEGFISRASSSPLLGARRARPGTATPHACRGPVFAPSPRSRRTTVGSRCPRP